MHQPSSLAQSTLMAQSTALAQPASLAQSESLTQSTSLAQPASSTTQSASMPTPAVASTKPSPLSDDYAQHQDPELDSMGDNFPVKLYRLIMDAEENQRDDVICFNGKGDAFLILNREALVEELVPRYFRLKSLASFRRQLYLYGFVKHREGRQKGYKHEFFRRGRPQALCLVRRTYDYETHKAASKAKKGDE